MLHFITERDYRLMRRANNWNAPRWVQLWMIGSTKVGDGSLWYAMGFAIFLFGGSERFAALCAAGLASLLSILLFQRLKKLTGRKRPCQISPHCWAATLLPPDQFSFPSGHTMTGFAVAVALSLFYPTLAIGLLFCALSIAISRIILGMHFLSDVAAGAVIGTLLGWGCFLIFA